MYTAKGFMAMFGLSNNALSKVGKFGELSTQSQTFTRDMRNYSKTQYPDVTLFMFKCIDEMNLRIEPSATFSNTLLALGEWIYQQHTSKLIPSNRNKATFVKAIEDQFSAIQSVLIGEILTGEPDMNMPDYIQFKLLDGTNQYQVTLWFSDEAFNTQYPETEIFIIPPLARIDDLIDSKTNVNNKMLALPRSYIVKAVQEIRGNNPETDLNSYELLHHDPNDPNSVLKTDWTSVIYGRAGNDVEAIKEAIREYIEEHSDYDKWDEIFPDLYSENEFMIIPFWGNLALQSDALKVGLYSSMINPTVATSIVKAFLPNTYNKTIDSRDFVDTNLLVASSMYRAAMFGIVGNPNNLNDTYNFREKFPDYMALSTEDVDFVRMEANTQKFALTLADVLNEAYKYKPTDTMKPEYLRIIRKNNHYISFIVDGYSYSVLTKYSYDRVYG